MKSCRLLNLIKLVGMIEDNKESQSSENEGEGMFYSHCWQQYFFFDINRLLLQKEANERLKSLLHWGDR